MKKHTDQRCRDSRKLALAEAARLKRSTRRKLEKQTTGSQGSALEVTSEMVTESLAKRNINQIDDISRRFVRPGGYGRDDNNHKNVYSTLSQIPFKALKMQVAWLTPSQQDATSVLTLSDELLRFAAYVRLDQQEVSARQSMLLDIEDVVRSKFPHASISQFGSYPVGLSVYSSDIDISVDNTLAVAIEGPISELSSKRPPPDSPSEHVRPNKRIRFDEGEGAVAEHREGSEQAGSKDGQDQTPEEETEGEEEEVSWMIDAGSDRRTGEAGSEDNNSEGEEDGGFVGSESDADGVGDTDAGSRSKRRNDGKLPLDIDVPVWDGRSTSASNAALQGGDDGVLHDSAVDALMAGHGYGAAAGGSGREQREAAERLKREKLEVLGKIFRVIKSMGWVRRAELRRHARVPIINLVHRNGVECDISLDMSAQDTSVVVARLVERCGPALFTLSAFLKVYLGQLGLDAPFTGGLGSYKLYVLLAKHLLDQAPGDGDGGGGSNGAGNQQQQEPALGAQLLGFLKHFGSRRNLNKGTVVAVEGAEPVNFTGTMRIEQVADAFSVAHSVLSKTSNRGVAAQSRSAAVIVPRPNSHSFLNSQVSHSHLAPLLNTAHLCSERAESRRLCQRHPPRTAAEREAVARAVLVELQRRVANNPAGLVPAAASYEEVLQCNPALAARLRSFASVSSAVGHLAGLTNSKRSQELQSQFGGLIPPPPQSGSAQITASSSSAMQSTDNGAAAQAVGAATTAAAAAATAPTEAADNPAVLAVIAELEAALTILVLQCYQPPPFFEPDSLLGQAIISGDRNIPPHTIFSKAKFVSRLPVHMVGALGPFVSLALAQRFVGKEVSEVREIQAREEWAEKRLHQLIASKALSDRGGPKERDFLRRCHIATLLPPSFPYTPQPALTPAEVRLVSVSKASRATIRSYVPAASVDFGAEDLRVLVLMRQQDQLLRTTARQSVLIPNTNPDTHSNTNPATNPTTNPNPSPTLPLPLCGLSADEQLSCLEAHVHLESMPLEKLVREQVRWWTDAHHLISAAQDGSLVRRKALIMHRRGIFPVPIGHMAFRHAERAVYDAASARADARNQYVALRAERAGRQDLLDELVRVQASAKGRAVAAARAGHIAEPGARGKPVGVEQGRAQAATNKRPSPSSATSPEAKKARGLQVREVVDLTAGSGESSADDEETGGEPDDVVVAEVEGGVEGEPKEVDAGVDVGKSGQAVEPVADDEEQEKQEGSPAPRRPAAAAALCSDLALTSAPSSSSRPGGQLAENKLEVPSLSKPNFGRRRSGPGQSSGMQKE